MADQIPISPAVLKWARERAGYSLEELSKNHKKLDEWENGESFPTYAQLEQLSDKLKCPVAVFFFPEPPETEDIEKSFRTLPEITLQQIPRTIKMLLRKAKAMQINLYELSDGINPAKNHILEDIKADVNTQIYETAKSIRDYLEVSVEDQSSWANVDKAFESWRKILNEHGIFVFKDAFKIPEFSGFCLYDPTFPIIYINNSLPKTRQIFTLFHELGHLLFNTSGVDKEHDDYIALLRNKEKEIEVFCNKFSGIFLVPDDDFNQTIKNIKVTDDSIQKIATKYKVSREVILRKLLDRKIVNKHFYDKKAEEWKGQISAEKKASSGDYYNNQITYLGDYYLNLAFTKFHQNKFNDQKLADYLNIKPKNVRNLEEKFARRGA